MATGSRHSRNSLAKYFGEKIPINFLNMDQFVTCSRHMKILTTYECRAKVCDKIRKTVARNLNDSEIPVTDEA